MKAISVIELCARECDDIAYERIARDSVSAINPNQANWLDWLNDAQRTTVLVRPDAGAVTQSVLLAAGTKQTLAASATAILSATRNMGADGLTPGKTIRFVEMAVKNDTNRDWHTAPNGTVVREVVYDDKKDPLTFYVSPPANARYIELVLQKVPAELLAADVLTAVIIGDLYAGPLQAWMLHRAYAVRKDGQQTAWQYFGSFFQQLGVKLRAELFAAAATTGERK